MQIQFAVNQASASSIQQLATNFLLTEPKDQNERIKLVNSLLITMSKTNKPLQKIFEVIVQIRQQQKQSKIGGLIKQNGCKLLEQIVTKYKPIMKQQQLDRNNLSEIKGERIVEKVIKYCCEGAISGLKPNQYINIIYQLHSKAKDVDEIKSLANKVILNNLLLNPKIHVSSFSQSSRHKLYNLLLSSVEELPIDLENSNNKKGENSQENSTKINTKQSSQYITLILNSISQQKDPRNMLTVFNLYLFILNWQSFSLQPFVDNIFQHLEQYYPLDFTGGQQHMKQYRVDCDALIAKLDQCLTHSVFLKSKHTQKMLMSKLSAPPIANCLGTLKMFFNRIRQHRIQCDASWYSLVVNFADQDYLQGVQQGDTSLGQAISTIINSLSYSFNKQLLLIPYKCSKSLTQICNKISMKIWSSTKQWKYTGVAITIIRTLNEKLQRLSALLSTYLLAQFIRNIATFSQLSNLENNKNLVSQLGVFLTIKFQAIRVHNQGVSNIESQSVILLFLIKVYQSNEGFLKVVVLKCLMQMQKNQKMKRMVIKIHKQNLIQPCIEMLKDKDSELVNSYIDYLIETDQQTLSKQLQEINSESIIYGALKSLKKLISQKIKQGTQANQQQSDFDRTCIVLIKCLNKSNTCFVSAQAILSQFTFVQLKDLIHILGNYNQSIENQSFLSALRKNVIDKISYQSLQQACLVKQFILSFQKYWQIFAFRNLWRNDLKDQKISSFIRAILDKHIQEQCSKQYYFQRICGIYFNNSIEILNIDHTLIIDRYANKHYIYFLPKGRNNNKGGEQIQIKAQNEVNKQLLYPTSIHYHWVESPTPILVSYLPQPLLKKYSDQILQMIMPLNSMVILNKILLHLPKTKISRHVITHCLKYLSKAFDSSCDQQKPVIEILTVQQIFNKLYHMNQADANAEDQDNTIFNVLQRQSDHIIQILRKGLQHRKRLVRQSSRLLLVKYQKLDSFKKY